MTKACPALFVCIVVALMPGCAAPGTSLNAKSVAAIKKGETTEADLYRRFGPPTRRTTSPRGVITLGWEQQNSKSPKKTLLVTLAPSGKVSFSASSGISPVPHPNYLPCPGLYPTPTLDADFAVFDPTGLHLAITVVNDSFVNSQSCKTKITFYRHGSVFQTVYRQTDFLPGGILPALREDLEVVPVPSQCFTPDCFYEIEVDPDHISGALCPDGGNKVVGVITG